MTSSFNTKIKVIDNFLDHGSFILIKNLLMGKNFPWYFKNGVVDSSLEQEINDPNTFQFVHLFFNVTEGGVCSNHISILDPILDKLNMKTILKIKSNLLTKNENPKYFSYHVDCRYPTAKTAIYYINTNNGSTIFEDGTEIESIENRMVVFENNIRHTGKSCSDKSTRVLINFNYFDY